MFKTVYTFISYKGFPPQKGENGHQHFCGRFSLCKREQLASLGTLFSCEITPNFVQHINKGQHKKHNYLN